MSQSLQGHFLVSAGHLRDPNFYRSVVLMLEHNDESAMGLIINRPSSLAVDAALSELGATSAGSDPIFTGGPVETTALFILHSCRDLAGKDEEVVPGLYVTGSNESFESLVANREGVSCEHDCGFRIYCGYSGWGPGQLEGEIERGDWLILPAEAAIAFADDPYNIWELCVQKIHEANRILPHSVMNPDWN
ncbi:MAG: YqgE/AlgH family protein [Planctomycetaceae bacterium]